MPVFTSAGSSVGGISRSPVDRVSYVRVSLRTTIKYLFIENDAKEWENSFKRAARKAKKWLHYSQKRPGD